MDIHFQYKNQPTKQQRHIHAGGQQEMKIINLSKYKHNQYSVSHLYY